MYPPATPSFLAPVKEFLDWVFRDPAVVQQYCLKSAKEGLHVVTEDSCQEFWKKFPEPEGHIESLGSSWLDGKKWAWSGLEILFEHPMRCI